VRRIRATRPADASRLVIRVSADAEGGLPRTLLALTRFLDGVTVRQQLVVLRRRLRWGAHRASRSPRDVRA